MPIRVSGGDRSANGSEVMQHGSSRIQSTLSPKASSNGVFRLRSLGEPDTRPMGIGSGRKPPSYNVQTAVDAATGLIVHHEVTTEPTDDRLLHPMAKATKDAVEADTLTAVADAGYSNGADAVACEAPAVRSLSFSHSLPQPGFFSSNQPESIVLHGRLTPYGRSSPLALL